MGRSNWRPLRGIDRNALRTARIQAHDAVQFLARSARAYVPPRADDGHTNLGWDGALGGFTTHPLKGDLRLGLSIADLTLRWLGEGSEPAQAFPQIFPLNGRADAPARKWLGEKLAAAGLDPGLLDKPSPYAMPDPAPAGGPVYDAAKNAAALAELAAWFANAHDALGLVREEMVARGFTVSPPRCWPHHFDLAALIALDPPESPKARSVNAGLSPGDGYYGEPYFYVSPYPYPGPAALPKLAKPGHWHTHDFTAAIAAASDILGMKDAGAAAEAFLRDAVAACIKALG
jgi:hypothetical protein